MYPCRVELVTTCISPTKKLLGVSSGTTSPVGDTDSAISNSILPGDPSTNGILDALTKIGHSTSTSIVAGAKKLTAII